MSPEWLPKERIRRKPILQQLQTIKKKRNRGKNWSYRDCCILIENYSEFHSIIIGSFKGIGAGAAKDAKRMKATAWDDLLNKFLADKPDDPRELIEIQNQVSNLRQKVRDYAKAKKWNLTGGGPPPEEPPSFILKLFEIVHGSSGDSLCGINSGMDSGSGLAGMDSVSGLAGMDSGSSLAVRREPTSDVDICSVSPTDSPLMEQLSSEDSASSSRHIAGRKTWVLKPPFTNYSRRSGNEAYREKAELIKQQVKLVKEHRELIAEQKVKTRLEIGLLKAQYAERGLPLPPEEAETPSRNLLNDSDEDLLDMERMASGEIPTPTRILRMNEY